MSRVAIVFTLIVALTPAFASEPGQPLDCSDWVFLEPGYSCTVLPRAGYRFSQLALSPLSILDNTGAQFLAVRLWPQWDDSCGQWLNRIELLADRGDENPRVLATIQARCFDPLNDRADQITAFTPGGITGGQLQNVYFYFDAVGGRLLVALDSICRQTPGNTFCDTSGHNYSGVSWIAAISGFAPLLEIFQTYTPMQSSVLSAPQPSALPNGTAIPFQAICQLPSTVLPAQPASEHVELSNLL